MGKTAFVTGATGFLGINLVTELVAQEWEVTVIHRSSSNLEYLAAFNLDQKLGSIEDYESVLEAMPQNIDAVFHVAASTSLWSRFNQEQYRTNVLGTQNVIRAAMAKKAGRFVHTSSISAFGFHSSPINEATPSNALETGINYFVTKYLAEQEVKKAAFNGLDTVILNPAHIVGPYDTHNWVQVFKNVHRGQMPGIPNTRGTFAFAPEVAKAHITAFEMGASGENYLLGGVEASMLDFVNDIERILGKPISTSTTPLWKLKIATRLFQLTSVFTNKEPILTPEKTKLLTHNSLCNDNKAQSQLNFKIIPLDQIVETTYQWLKKERII